MRIQRFSIATIATLLCIYTALAQDDTYYSPQNDAAYQNQQNNDQTDGYGNPRARQYDSPDYTTTETDASGNTYITNNYYYDDDDYDYRYSCNLRRFYAPTYGMSFWGGYYTNYYYYSYDPWLWGVNINISNGWWGWGWNRPWWRRSVVVYDPWYDPWFGYNSWGCNVVVFDPYWYRPWGWNSYCYNNGWYNNGWGWGGNSYWNGYNNGYANGYWDGYWDGYNNSWYGGSCWNSGWRMDAPTNNTGNTGFGQTTSYSSANSLWKHSKMTNTELSSVNIPREGIQKPLPERQLPQSNISNHSSSPTRLNEGTTKTPQAAQSGTTDSRSNVQRFDGPQQNVRANNTPPAANHGNQRTGSSTTVQTLPKNDRPTAPVRSDNYSEQRYQNNPSRQPVQTTPRSNEPAVRADSYVEERYNNTHTPHASTSPQAQPDRYSEPRYDRHNQNVPQRQRESVQPNQQTDRERLYRERNTQPRQYEQRQQTTPRQEPRYERPQRTEPRYEQRQAAPQQRMEPRGGGNSPRMEGGRSSNPSRRQ